MKRVINRHFERIDSTNTWAKAHIAEFEKGTFQVITAKEQSSGRGRDGRSFVSPAGGLYLTCAFEMPIPNAKAAPLSVAIGASIAAALEVKFKWPNDLIFQQKKVGGLLIESINSWWIVGVGVNVDTPLDLLSSVKEISPTSLKAIGSALDVDRAASKVSQVIYEAQARFLAEGFSPFLECVHKNICCKKGEVIWVRVGREEKVKAQYEGIDKEGRLLVYMQDKESSLRLKALSQAEVFFQ